MYPYILGREWRKEDWMWGGSRHREGAVWRSQPSPATCGMARMLSVLRVSWMVWTVARLEPLHYENISGTVPRRRDHASRNSGWTLCGRNSRVRNAGEAPCCPHPGTVHGEPLRRDCTCVAFPCLQGPIKKDPKCVIPPSLPGGPVVKPRKLKRKWVCQEQSVLCREREHFESRTLKF